MRYLVIIIVLMSITKQVWADDRYLSDEKVSYETPQEHEILKVNTALGFCTVLEFPDKPTLVSVGDNALIQVEVPDNSKSIVIKPLEETGETNLFVFTPTQRFNYKVAIGMPEEVDYVIATKALASPEEQKPIAIGDLLKMAKNYQVLKELGNINEREFVQKDLLYECRNPMFDITAFEAFSYKDPHYVLLHLQIKNITSETYNLNEEHTNVYINGQKFKPQYVMFDNTELQPGLSTEAWFILSETFISLENNFTFGIGVNDEEEICY